MSHSHANPDPEDTRLTAWLDGELSEQEQRELEAEFARDPALRADLEALESVVRLVREEGPTVAPPGFHQRVMMRVAELEPAPEPGLVAWVSSWMRRWEMVALVGVAVAAVLLVVPFGLSSPTPDANSTNEVSPGAVRLQSPEGSTPPARSISEPSITGQGPTAAPSDVQVPKTEVLGRARVEPQAPTPYQAIPQAAENGTNLAWDRDPEPPSAPEGALTPDATGSADGSVRDPDRAGRYVVTSDDPALKRRVLALASRYGSVHDGAGNRVATSDRAENEELVVTVSQAELPAFTRGLTGLGFDVGQLPDGLLAGQDVQIRLLLKSETSSDEPVSREPGSDEAVK